MPVVNAKRLITAAVVVVLVAAAALTMLEVSGRTGLLSNGRVGGSRSPLAAASGPGANDPLRAAWVVEENAKPGSPSWRLTGPLNQGNIEGYANATSIAQGESVKLYVSTDAPSYVVQAYRMGHYGGVQARMIWESEPLPGRRQADPDIDPNTNTVEAGWQSSLTVKTDRSWPPGDYLFKLDASNDYGQYIPLVVRNDASKSALLVMNAVTTWQAYNTWGGHSLYEGRVGRSSYGGEGRAQVVSFDRPYKNDSGSGDFLGNELPFISYVESLGLDVSYWTNIDLHQRPQLLRNHRALITLGHDEYWTLEMRDAVEQARDRGMNVIFFGANAVFRSIRLEPSGAEPARREVNYRSARDDPLYRVDDSRVTVSWRDPPLNRPESTLTGTYYECNPVEADMVIADAAAWVFDGTDLENGDRIADLVGPEYDRYTLDYEQPPGPVQVLAHSPLRCRGDSTFSDMTYYSTPSGAGVFSTGTNWWISRLGPRCGDEACDPRVARITANVLEAFATGPAGRAHPSRSNYAEVTGRRTSTTSTTSRSGTTTTVEEIPVYEQPVPDTPALPFPTTPPSTLPAPGAGPTTTRAPRFGG